jgi:hypothetical protein
MPNLDGQEREDRSDQRLAQEQSRADASQERDGKADTDRFRLARAFGLLSVEERQMLICALAGNFPERFSDLRMPVLRGLAKADGDARRKVQRENELQGARDVL